MKRHLLPNSATTAEMGYLDDCEAEMLDFLGPVRKLLPLSLALHSRWLTWKSLAKVEKAEQGWRPANKHEPGFRTLDKASAAGEIRLDLRSKTSGMRFPRGFFHVRSQYFHPRSPGTNRGIPKDSSAVE